MLKYQQFIDIGLSPDEHSLQSRLVTAIEAMGFGLCGGTFIRGRLASGSATVRALGNTPAGFLEASRSLDAGLRDPLLTAMLASPGCFTYDQHLYTSAGAGDLWDNQAAFGYRSGIAISVHESSHLEMFSFGVDGPDELPRDPVARLSLEAQLRLLALHAHEAAKRLWTAAPGVDLNSVTQEEVSALKWARDGVCVWATGEKLVYSNPGLVKAQRSAARTLGTSGIGAVLRAIDGGLID
jgi:LuxR family transcriptional regulator